MFNIPMGSLLSAMSETDEECASLSSARGFGATLGKYGDTNAAGYGIGAAVCAAVGYCFGENGDHMATPDIPDIETRDAMAATGEKIICKMVERMNMLHVVEQLRKLEAYGLENEKKFLWMPAAWNRNH